MAFVSAGKRVEVVGKQTWLEAIYRGNMAGKPVVPNAFYNKVFLGKDADGRFKPVPDEILNARPLYSGTLGVVGNKGRPLGTSVEAQCEYAGTMKSVIVRPGKEDTSRVDTILASDHLFGPDGKPLLPLSNAKTGKPIRNDDEMGEADEVLLTMNGQTRKYVLKSRDGGVLEAVGNENTYSYVSDTAAIGLLRRGISFNDYGRHGVILDGQPSSRFGVVREAADAIVAGNNAPIERGVVQSGGSAPLETSTTGLSWTVQGTDTLVVKGATTAQLEATVRFLETLKRQ